MAFIDELTLHIKAGDGGDGVTRWIHEKGKEYGGPGGGDGGKGGDVYARTVRDITILSQYKNTKEFVAKDGADGMNFLKSGKSGDDLFINFPIGSIITNTVTGRVIKLETDGEEVLLLKGGHGGLGNDRFKSSTNVRPEESTPGKKGEEADFTIELELVADAGLIGLPNAGKSSLINTLTNAKSKVGAYQFTTLEPALGDMHGYILADIPGLIEGASEGRGLGHKFLRHIKRTKMLLHCVSLENEDLLAVYKTIRAELEKYSSELAEKEEVVILTKTDVLTPAEVKKAVVKMKKITKKVLTVSILDDGAVKALKDDLVKMLRATKA